MGEELKRLLFIVTAHENNECLLDTVNNIKKFNPDVKCLIAIHISEKFKDFEEQTFSSLTDVIYIRNQAKTFNSRWESLLLPIMKTYEYAKKMFGENFDYVSIFHTSQLFVRYGYYDYIKNFDTSFNPRTDMLPERYYPIFDMKLFENVFDDYCDLSNYFYQGVELGFYSKEIFDTIQDTINNKFPISCEQLNNFFNYTPVEEVVIPTIAMKYSNRVGRNVILTLNDFSGEIRMNESEFSIKSVPRDINHPVRVKIRSL